MIYKIINTSLFDDFILGAVILLIKGFYKYFNHDDWWWLATHFNCIVNLVNFRINETIAYIFAFEMTIKMIGLTP